MKSLTSIRSTLKVTAATFVVAASLFAATSGTSAQEISDEHMAAARKALTATKASDPFDLILPALSTRLKNERISLRPDLSNQISLTVDEATLAVAKRRGDLEKEAARIYAKSFTIEELKAVEEFFRDGPGAKFLKEAPVLARQLDEASKIWTQGVARDLAADVEKRLRDQGVE
ncbi:MAG: DUF2059 domain-containing protein [Pseudomonadota bacterium]